MIVTIICHGLPNTHSEQANCDPFLYLKEFRKKKISVNIISIYEERYNTSNIKKNEQKNFLKKNFNNINKISIINVENKNFFKKIKYFILRFFFLRPYFFFGNKEVFSSFSKEINKTKSDFYINFYDLPIVFSGFHEKNFIFFNIFGINRKQSEVLRIKNLLRSRFIKNFLQIINSFIYILKIDSIYKICANKSILNLCPGYDTYKYLKKIGIKNVIYTRPLSKDLSSIKKKKKSTIIVLLIGNLYSNIMQDSLNLLAYELIARLKKIHDKIKFQIRIVGKFKPKSDIKKKLDYNWIKFVGWVKNSNKEYARADYLFAPNSYSLSPRTKIIEAMSCGTIVISSKENINGIYNDINSKKDLIVAKNNNDFCRQFGSIIKDKNKQKYISSNAKKKYKKSYDPKKIIKNNINIMLSKFYEETKNY